MSPQKLLTTVRKKKGKDESRLKEGISLAERREHPRVSVELPFDYSFVENEETHRGMVTDASEGGLLVQSSQNFEIGALLKVEMLLAKGTELNAIKAITKVVWSELAAKECWAEYRYGLQFLSFFEGDLHKLKTLLREMGQTHG